MAGIGTFWRTVRHLKPEQVIGRLRFSLQKLTPDLRPAPPQRASPAGWVTPAMRELSLVAPMRLRLLNVERDVDHCGWDDASIEKLWRYNLHYFDDLNARDAPTRAVWQRALIARWIEANPPARGTGWEPYPVSLRIVNWIKWFTSGAPAESAWLHSLAVQTRWLLQRLEWHLLGNHLFANAKALVFAGLFFESQEAEHWLHCGVQMIERELPEQILTDGGQFERSPMYHALALEDVLDIVNMLRAHGPTRPSLRGFEAQLCESSSRMLYWLRCMTHNDGSVGLFNDAAEGIAPSACELERYAAQLEVAAPQPLSDAITHLLASGYVRASRGIMLALLDVAPVGPSHLPAHAHADTLSFELSLGRQRVIVNGGTSCYGTSKRRIQERGTAAHSTVEVAGADSSEIWSSFRVGRRARPSAVDITDWEVCCSHDGYRFLPGRPVHRRCWRFGVGELIVEDTVAPGEQPALARYILAPGLRLHLEHTGYWQVLLHNDVVVTIRVSQGLAHATTVNHAPQFGVVLPTDCLAIVLVDGRATTQWNWIEDASSFSS